MAPPRLPCSETPVGSFCLLGGMKFINLGDTPLIKERSKTTHELSLSDSLIILIPEDLNFIFFPSGTRIQQGQVQGAQMFPEVSQLSSCTSAWQLCNQEGLSISLSPSLSLGSPGTGTILGGLESTGTPHPAPGAWRHFLPRFSQQFSPSGI